MKEQNKSELLKLQVDEGTQAALYYHYWITLTAASLKLNDPMV